MSRARDLSRIVNPTNFTVDTVNSRVGLGSTVPAAKLAVSGIVSATSFYGDGSNLEGVASAGLGTALGETNGLEVIYYTDNVLSIGATITIDPPTSTNVAYTQYAEVSVSDTADLIVAGGDDFIPDILGLSTEGITPISGTGGRVRADFYTNHAGTGAPTFQNGINVTAGTASFTGNVSIGGTLTYEDVTNVDSVGIITARSGVIVGGNILPDTSGTIDLGSNTKRWANLYTSDFDLSNESRFLYQERGNEVDGTWGAYTIQEGENDLFLINRRNGKKYKFVLQEITS